MSICSVALSCSTPAKTEEVKTEEIKNDGVSPSSSSVSGVFAPYLKLGEGKFKITSKDSYLKLTIPIEVIKRYETNEIWKKESAKMYGGSGGTFQQLLFNNYDFELTLLDENNAPIQNIGSMEDRMDLDICDAILKGSGLIYYDFYSKKSYSKTDSLSQKSDLEMLIKNAVKFTVNTTLNFDDSINK
jgi:hypothetical protein